MATTEVIREKTYLELISQDEKTILKEDLKLKAQEANLEISREVLNITKAINVKKSEVEKLKRAIPYSAANEYVASQQLAELEKRLAFLEEVKNKRFTDLNS